MAIVAPRTGAAAARSGGARSVVYRNAAGKTFEAVVVSGNSEVVTIEAIGASAGTFTLTWQGVTTGAINFDAAAAAIQTAVDTAWGAGKVTVSGGAFNAANVLLTFIGDFAGRQVPPVTANFAGLTGGTPTLVTTDGGTTMTIRLTSMLTKAAGLLTGKVMATANRQGDRIYNRVYM